jgi:hypothetical protein
MPFRPGLGARATRVFATEYACRRLGVSQLAGSFRRPICSVTRTITAGVGARDGMGRSVTDAQEDLSDQ